MQITQRILNEIEQNAKKSPRLRSNLCLNNSPEDKVQKMINVLLPGTKMPIHRHLYTDETLVLLKGTITIAYYDNQGLEIDTFYLSKDNLCAINIPRGQWHNIIVKEVVALFEIKEGPYRPLTKEEILQ